MVGDQDAHAALPEILDDFLDVGDGERIDARQTMICVCNGRWYGGGFNPVPDAELDDGLLDVVIVEKVERKKLISRLIGLMQGKILSFPETRFFRASSVSFSAPDMRVNVDGEIVREETVSARILPGALMICR